MKSKFHVCANLDYQGRLDISSKREVRKFQALVEPLMHPSMVRKSTRNKWKEWKARWLQHQRLQDGTCRTSIYLPYDLYDALRGKGYSQFLNCLLSEWMDKQWAENVVEPSKRYRWLLKHDDIPKGYHLLTPRFRADVKARLDILSDATGLERSELVVLALRNQLGTQ